MEEGEERAYPQGQTGRTPASALLQEPLLPRRPYRIDHTGLSRLTIGKTAFVEFDRYSVPTDYADMGATILVYPSYINIVVEGRKIAHHVRSFDRHQKIENPSHREKLLDRTPHGKHERIYHLMKGMGKEIDDFIAAAESEGEDRLKAAHGLFRLLLRSSKE